MSDKKPRPSTRDKRLTFFVIMAVFSAVMMTYNVFGARDRFVAVLYALSGVVYALSANAIVNRRRMEAKDAQAAAKD
jgi:predicted membrane channel-forming protein YqfA (hemolysin III family)